MARVILTYSRGWHSLAICRSLGRQGIEVYCGEESPFAPCFFSKYCTGHFQYPSVSDDPEAFIHYSPSNLTLPSLELGNSGVWTTSTEGSPTCNSPSFSRCAPRPQAWG